MKIKFLLYIISIFLTALLLSSCGKSNHMNSAEKYVEEMKARPPKSTEPIPEIQNVTPVKYSLSQERDPYLRIVSRNPGDNMIPDMKRKKEPLEAYSLDSLKVIGMIVEDGRTWAIVSTPDNMVYPVTAGDYLGQNYGKVIGIDSNRVQLEETLQVNGAWQARRASIALVSEEDQNNPKPSSAPPK